MMSQEGTSSNVPSDARSVAAAVLLRVWQDDAYAAPTLNAALERAPQLDPRDVGLATELVYGVLRTEGVLLKRLEEWARDARWQKRMELRAIMLLGAYSLLFLDRVPAFAAVSAAVASVKRSDDRNMAGFCNAVLRKLAAQCEEQAKAQSGAAAAQTSGRAQLDHAALLSLPRWLRAELQLSLGEDPRTLLSSPLDADVEADGTSPVAMTPPLCLAIAFDQSREHWLETLRQHKPSARIQLGTLSPRCLRLHGAGDPRQLPGVGDAWRVQEEGAQWVGLALGARPGDEVLDACAGRGGKSWLLAQQVGSAGALDAADRYPAKLQQLRRELPANALREAHALDWSRGSGGLERRYDRVLVDAPCSGVGTLRRRPEIARRLTSAAVAELAELQRKIARQAATHVKDGGRLVYAVCSVLRRECEDVVQALLDEPPAGVTLEAAPFDSPEAKLLLGDAAAEASSVRLTPRRHGCDGYFIASFRVRRPTSA